LPSAQWHFANRRRFLRSGAVLDKPSLTSRSLRGDGD
jgi:hypothetical protein